MSCCECYQDDFELFQEQIEDENAHLCLTCLCYLGAHSENGNCAECKAERCFTMITDSEMDDVLFVAGDGCDCQCHERTSLEGRE